MKNEREKLILFWLSFCHLFGAWKIPKIYQKAQCELKCQAVSQLDKVVKKTDNCTSLHEYA